MWCVVCHLTAAPKCLFFCFTQRFLFGTLVYLIWFSFDSVCHFKNISGNTRLDAFQFFPQCNVWHPRSKQTYTIKRMGALREETYEKKKTQQINGDKRHVIKYKRARQVKFIRSLWIICAYTRKRINSRHVRTLKVGWQRASSFPTSSLLGPCCCYFFYYKQYTYDNLYKHAIKYYYARICCSRYMYELICACLAHWIWLVLSFG